MSCRFAPALLPLLFGWLNAQQAPPAPAPASEMTTKEEPATFRSRVNLVMVPVVVRDKEGRPVGTLRQEDFQLFDRNKAQAVTRFTVEKASGKQADKAAKSSEKSSGQAPAPDLPDRFVAYLFDDIHLVFSDLVRTREAAAKHMDTLRLEDRAAIYTTSGQGIVEFTDDRDALRQGLNRLMPRPLSTTGIAECPDISYYQADQIQNHSDTEALNVAVEETLSCLGMDPATMRTAAESIARSTASKVFSVGTQETRVTLYTLRDVVRRMAAAPGQRIVVLASPGFLAPEQQSEKTDIMDRAIRANVVISSVDVRGLWTEPFMDVSQRGNVAGVTQAKDRFMHTSALLQSDVLAEMAAGTGGSFFQNNNDLFQGFRESASMPDYVYMLGFSPQNLKLDGSFHALKVTLKARTGTSVSARKGYYAPKHLDDAVETARREIEEALFSREEMRELPIDLTTQFFKPSDESARVSVLAHVDLKGLNFRKVEDRNNNILTIVSAVFDRNGNYVTGNKKTLEMRLRDETLAGRAASGLTVRSTFDVKPGVYMVRLVVRDSEGQMMTAQNGAVNIPN
jgi:VWFA-related protein